MNDSTVNPEADPKRIDFKTVIATLRAGNATNEWYRRWLPSTYAAPDAFKDALYAHAMRRRGGLKSSAARSFDFYHDCVLAHLGQSHRALIVRSAGRDVELTYDELDARASGLMLLWQRDGASPGQCVCILLEMGVDHVVALVTALRMGLVVSTLPAWGPSFVRSRVLALAPDYVVGSARQLTDLGAAASATLPSSAGRASAPGTHSYAAEEPVLRLLPAFGDEDPKPLDLAAASLHSSLLRDGSLVFCLEPGDAIALPDFDPRVMLPTALMLTLLQGATWSEWQLPDLQRDPNLLKSHSVSLLGVSPSLANQLLATGKWPAGTLRAWFRSLTSAIDFATFNALGQLSQKANVASFNLGYCASVGGVLLAGPPNRDLLSLDAWPPAGESWQLGEVGASQLRALNESGVYAKLSDGKAVEGGPQLLLSEMGQSYLCAGAIDVGPDATAYPIEDVSNVVEAHPNVRHASVVVTPGSTSNQARITLLVFVEEPSPTTNVEIPDLFQRIEREMGRRFLPSRVELYTLRPRLVDGEVDRSWCRSQYLSGALAAKARSELFLLLSRLGTLFDVYPQATA